MEDSWGERGRVVLEPMIDIDSDFSSPLSLGSNMLVSFMGDVEVVREVNGGGSPAAMTMTHATSRVSDYHVKIFASTLTHFLSGSNRRC